MEWDMRISPYAAEVLGELDALISLLELPLSSEEIASGWTTSTQTAILDLLKQLRLMVAAGTPVPDLSLGYGLDQGGVEGGELLCKACSVSNKLSKLSDGRPWTKS
jgi:hypothetical protein